MFRSAEAQLSPSKLRVDTPEHLCSNVLFPFFQGNAVSLLNVKCIHLVSVYMSRGKWEFFTAAGD